MADTLARETNELTRYAVEAYTDALPEFISYLLDKGEVPGVRKLSKRELRRFFEEETDSAYWLGLAKTEPLEALSQLEQFAEVSGDGD